MVPGRIFEQHANTMIEEELSALVELLDYPEWDASSCFELLTSFTPRLRPSA